jgi:hypothetical protein
MTARTKMGVRFDHVSYGCRAFNYRAKKGGERLMIKSHRMVFFLVNGYLPDEVDRIDNNPFNAHPSNLRASTRSRSSMNSTSRKGSTSKFLGVHWYKSRDKWRVALKFKGKMKHLGYFTDEIEAASHYNLAAMEYHGEFANLNDLRDH